MPHGSSSCSGFKEVLNCTGSFCPVAEDKATNRAKAKQAALDGSDIASNSAAETLVKAARLA